MDPTIGLNSYSVAYRQPQEFSISNQVNYFYDLKIQENMKQDPLNDKMFNSAQQLVKQIRSGRKVFKLLRYVEEFNDLVLEVKDFSMSHLQSALRSIFVDFKCMLLLPWKLLLDRKHGYDQRENLQQKEMEEIQRHFQFSPQLVPTLQVYHALQACQRQAREDR